LSDDAPCLEYDSGRYINSVLLLLRNLLSILTQNLAPLSADYGNQMPAFDNDSILWGQRQIRSVANMTRRDARDFLSVADQLRLQPKLAVYSLEDANEALLAMKNEFYQDSGVIVP
jgi:propanol-preferring alcohol dehydrogenase